jgi:hypothetical protein
MIQLQTPALALNDVRCPGPVFMDRSLKIQKDDSRQNIVSAVANFAANAPGGKLKSLVLNCHGAPGYLIMGQGFSHADVQVFQQWRGRVDTIWITACQVASRVYAQPQIKKFKGFPPCEVSDGFLFCRQMAMNAQANVVASLDFQEAPNSTAPKGYVDSYEGTHFCWKPDGNVAWARRFALNTFE